MCTVTVQADCASSTSFRSEPMSVVLWRRSIAQVAIWSLAAFFFSACGIFTGTDCNAVAGYALRVAVTDSATGLPPTTVPSLTVTDGDFSETHPSPDLGGGSLNEFLAAKERPGEYRVLVRAAGYADWQRNGIRVQRRGECRVIETVLVNARVRKL